MTDFSDVLVALADSILAEAGGPADGVRVRVSGFQLDLPLEGGFGQGARLEATLPRGTLATGFDVALGRVRARFERSDG